MSDNESFFREVEEDYQRERIIRALQDYSAWIIGGAFVIIALAAGYTIEKSRKADNAARGGDALTIALSQFDESKTEEAQKGLAALATNGPPSYKVLAQLHLAADYVTQKKFAEAAKYYQNVANDGGAPQDLRNFARIQLAALSVDSEPYEAIQQKIGDLRSGSGAWRYYAKEILGLSAMKAGKRQEAETLFQEILSDGGAPVGMRQQAEVLLALILEKPKLAKAEPTAKGNTPNDAKTQ